MMTPETPDVAGLPEKSRGRCWLPFLGIVVASALAHLWCLGSQFYLDDKVAILGSDVLRNGRFWETKLNIWTYFGYVIQYRLFGLSAVGFHAVNWVLHTAVACVLFGFGREFIKERWPAGVALFGALLFAVHPLGSEIPNYARTQDLAWVTLFSLLAAWALLRFLRVGGWWKLAACVIFIAGATLSKGPGMFHALMMSGAIGLACMPPRGWGMLKGKPWLWAAGVAVLLAGLWISGLLAVGLVQFQKWSEPRMIGHGFTVARVFWEFAWRSLIPVGLSADHHIAETLIPPGAGFWDIPDRVAMLAAVGFLGMAALGGFLAWRKSTRLFGICLSLFVATILFRLMYLIPEFMPEYRIYPGLPWFGLGTAILLAAFWKWMFPTASPKFPAVVLIGLLAFLSAKRSFLWHDLDHLMADVLKQYPAQGRAIWELHDRDLAAGNWQAVIDRQERVWPEVRRKFILSLTELRPGRELPSGHFSLAEVACGGRYARAVAKLRSPAEGLQLMSGLEAYMRALAIDPKTNPVHWSTFSRDKGLVLEMAGNYSAAAEALRVEGVSGARLWDLERVERKLAAAK